MKLTLLLICLFTTAVSAIAQTEDVWDTYLADYDGKPGSTVLNMSLINTAPVKGFDYVLVTGVTFKDCSTDGFPKDKEFENLYAIEEAVKKLVDSAKSKHAGTFTHRCERLDYYYIKDTTNLRTHLTNLYQTQFPAYKAYINIKTDKDWNTYRDFLYPNEITQEYMRNTKVILKLNEAGDALVKPRQVDHWLYFKTAIGRTSFIEYVKKNGYKIESTKLLTGVHLPYQLQISRTDKVDLGSISKVTIELNEEAKKHGGDYDGWETFIVK